MKTNLVLLAFLMGLSRICVADTYEYTDSDDTIHFTDDLSKVPVAKRNTRKVKTAPSLTPEEYKTVNVIIKLDSKRGQDVSVKDLPSFKKNVKQFGDAFKDELGDPVEPKDSRLSSPEGAWNLFIEGLMSGNLNYIKSSLIGKRWERGNYGELDKSIMAQFGKELAKLIIISKKQEENSAVFEIRSHKSGIDGTIEFINFYGNWKIYRF